MTRANAPNDMGGTGALLLAAAALVTRNAQAQNAKLLVFLHVAVKQRALQGELQAALSGVEVTAVGRIGDFERSLKDGTDAVLATPPVLSAFKLGARLRGAHGGSVDERCSLVGVGAAPDPGTVKVVGALDVLGRDGTNAFVRELLAASPRVERVSKVEDLLPLLQMQRVDAVVLPSRLFSEIKTASKLALVQKELDKTIGLPAVATMTPAGAQVVTAISRMPTAVAKTLGVDSWR
jgi:hypothetical protein